MLEAQNQGVKNFVKKLKKYKKIKKFFLIIDKFFLFPLSPQLQIVKSGPKVRTAGLGLKLEPKFKRFNRKKNSDLSAENYFVNNSKIYHKNIYCEASGKLLTTTLRLIEKKTFAHFDSEKTF